MNQDEPIDPRGVIEDEEESSFFVGSVKEESQKPEEQQPQDHAHQYKPRQKKKHLKKKQKLLKPPKKTHNTKEKQREMRLLILAEKQADEIIAKMKYYFQKDLELQQKKKLACMKLKYMDQLTQELKNIHICQKFIERDGLSLFERWLDKVIINEEAVEPGFSLRKGVLEILLSLNINTENMIKTNDVARLVARQKRSQMKELRELSEKILLKWNKIAYDAQQ